MNWGYRLMTAFIAFALMIGYLVYRAVNTNFELVKADYYNDELAYQKVIDGRNKANALSTLPLLSQDGSTVALQMPDEMKSKNVTGKIWFYCAYDEKKDRKAPLQIDEHGLQLFDNFLTAGNYTVKIDWDADGENYYTERSLTVR